MKTENVKDLWWEEDNLHIITEDGKHHIFEKAYLSECKTEPIVSDAVIEIPVTFNHRGFI